MESEPAFERRRGGLLLRVGGDQGRVDIDDQRRRGVASWSGACSPASAHTRARAAARARVDRGQRRWRVGGQRVDRAGHRRVRGHPAEDARLGAQQRDVGQAVPAQRQRHAPGRARPCPGRGPPAACATAPTPPTAPRPDRQRRPSRSAAPHRPAPTAGPGRVDPDARIEPATLLHLEGAPRSLGRWSLRQDPSSLVRSTFQLINTRSSPPGAKAPG